MSDIVEKLRAVVKRAWSWDYHYPGNLNVESLIVDLRKEAEEAADEIERLREALRPFARAADQLDKEMWDDFSIEGSLAEVTGSHCRAARAALPKGAERE